MIPAGTTNAVRLPMGAGDHLPEDDEQLPAHLCFIYHELVGAFLYLSTCLIPDIAFAVRCLSRHVGRPTGMHLAAAKKVQRYIKGTSTVSLTNGRPGTLMRYSDAEYAGDLDTRRSTTGFLFTLNRAAVSCGRKRQATESHSTTEAEYVAAAAAAKEVVWLRRVMLDIRGKDAPVRKLCDS